MSNQSFDKVSGEEPAHPFVSGVEPLTVSLLGRFFGVPLLIIGTIVGGAVLVVLLFAGPAAPPTRTMEQLLQALESNSGEKSLGVLLPREKELWQTALELSQRLEKKDKELTPAEVDEVAARLARMIESDLENLNLLPTTGNERARQQELRSARLEFLIRALGQTQSPVAVGPLLDLIRSEVEPFAGIAMQVVGTQSELHGSQEVLSVISEAVRGGRSAATLITGCTVLSVLATPGDREVRDTLADARLKHEGEVAWSAALAMARLGDGRGRSTLMDLLDRGFLESPDLYVATDADGNVKGRYPLSAGRVEALLIAAIEAASHLNDGDLWEMIERLQSDPSFAVQGKAKEAMARRQS
jgi:HEAT repeat protein